jgi:spoIIIJ-associated protein
MTTGPLEDPRPGGEAATASPEGFGLEEDRLDGDAAIDEGAGAAPDASPGEVAAVAAEFLTGLIDAMGLRAEVTTRVEGERALIDVTGDDLGAVIGRRGQTLDALQELVRTAVQRRLRSRVRLLVDIEGYRARRRASLADYARAMAQRARERGTEIELEPMNAYERKIVHDAIAEVEGASSFSEGEEPNRKLIVRGE